MQIRQFLKSGHTPTLGMSFLYFDISFMIWILMGALGAFISFALGGAALPAILGFVCENAGSFGSGFFFFSIVSLGAAFLLVQAARGWNGNWVDARGCALVTIEGGTE